MNEELASKVHHAFLEPSLQTGRAPSASMVAAKLGIGIDAVRDSLCALEQGHGAVLHPHVCEPWIIHPISFSPSATWVEADGRGWWAPCMWCACGIATLAGEPVTIHARFGGEADDVDIHVQNGRVVERDLCVHFAVPPRSAWDNVHHYCATVLPFRSADEVDQWCERHAISKGAVVPAQQVADLGREWYGTYANADWKKWSVREAAQIFERVGLTGEFWKLPEADGRF